MSSEVNPTQSSYDEVADEYTQRIGGELEHKPLERELLARFAHRATRTPPGEARS